MKKNEKFMSVLNTIGDKYLAEADSTKNKKGFNIKKFAIIAACFCLVFTSLNLWLFMPLKSIPENISMYKDSKYFSLIEKLNTFYTAEPVYKNNFAWIADGFLNFGRKSNNAEGFIEDMPTVDGLFFSSAGSLAEENKNDEEEVNDVTDNQVKGVIEADIVKRSDSHIFYLNNSEFIAYSIAGEASKEVGRFSLDQIPFLENEKESDIYRVYYYYETEFFLTSDCSTAVFVLSGYEKSQEDAGEYINIIALDVRDPENMVLINSFKISGAYSTLRYVDGKLLLISEFYVPSNADYSDETQFLPQYDCGNGQQSVPMENIIAPDVLTSARYAVVTLLDADTLTLEGCTALLSYSRDVYVSKDTVYLTREFINETKEGSLRTTESMTEICGVSYSGGELKEVGKVTVEGYIKDQYSLDEYEGILRVVTTTSKNSYKETIWGDDQIMIDLEMPAFARNTSASLFCIDLSNWKVRAKVEEFAPVGETVRSVRFDAETAYVCTAIQVTDPVFFFDLSDLDNITYKDTGNIEGYSDSLINFGDGFLLGIGVGSEWGLKLEIYEETADGVRSVCEYTEYANFASDYKAYFIDREKGLIGLGIDVYNDSELLDEHFRYVLFKFDGYKLHEIVNDPLYCSLNSMRAVLVDGYFYILGGDNFIVENIGIK